MKINQLPAEINVIITDIDLPAGRMQNFLENKLNITHQVELAKAEEKTSKQKAKQLFDSGDITKVEVGTFAGLSFIPNYLKILMTLQAKSAR